MEKDEQNEEEHLDKKFMFLVLSVLLVMMLQLHISYVTQQGLCNNVLSKKLSIICQAHSCASAKVQCVFS